MLALTITRLQLQELLRRRLFLVLLLLTVVVIALTTWGFSRIPSLGEGQARPISDVQRAAVASQLLILVMFMFSFVLAFSAVFAAAPAISAEVESGTTLAMLARPITRLEYVVGKWLGLVATVLIYAIPAASIQMVLVQIVVGYSPPRAQPAWRPRRIRSSRPIHPRRCTWCGASPGSSSCSPSRWGASREKSSDLGNLILVKHAMPQVDVETPAHEWRLGPVGVAG